MLDFDLGPVRAMDRNEMKAATELHDLNQSFWLDNIARRLRGGQTRRPYIDDLAVTFPASAMQISWQGESL